MVDPPLYAGTVNDTVACALLPELALTAIGGPDAVGIEVQVGKPLLIIKNCPSCPLGSLAHLLSLL
jgi:hypothetical protein